MMDPQQLPTPPGSSQPPQPPSNPPAVNIGPLIRFLLRGIAIVGGIALGGYGLLILMWVILKPRW